MKRTVILFAAMALILSAGAANAQRWGRGMGGPGMMGGYGQDYGNQGYGYGQDYGETGDYGYGLSEEQAAKYREIYDKYARDLYEMRAELYQKLGQLNTLLWGDKISTSEVDGLVKEINKLHSNMFSKRVDMKLELAKNNLPMSLSCPGGGAGGCPGGGYGMMGPGMGRGMMHPGMMGPGMMGPGMMYRGRGRGMGPGMMYDQGYGQMGPGMMRGWGYMPHYGYDRDYGRGN